MAVANFIGLATGTKDWTDPTTKKKVHHKPLYDGTTFHRVIPEFMIQGGDPTGTGMGDPGYTFNDEFDPNLNFDVPGRLAMANSGPNTNGSQFFITEQAYDSLNQHYTIFGQCDDPSVPVVKAIARVQRDSDDKPLTPVVLKKVTIVPEGQPSASAAPAPKPRPAPNLQHLSLNYLPTSQPGAVIRRSATHGPTTSKEFTWHKHQEPTPSSTPPKARSPSASLRSDAPVTVKNFIDLAEGKKEWTHPTTRAKSTDKLFDGTIFHRVIPDFMIQGGDPTGTGMGGPGYQVSRTRPRAPRTSSTSPASSPWRTPAPTPTAASSSSPSRPPRGSPAITPSSAKWSKARTSPARFRWSRATARTSPKAGGA